MVFNVGTIYWSFPLVVGLGFAMGVEGSSPDCLNYHQVNYYELFVSPDIDGLGNPDKQNSRMVDTPARLFGDGFGSRAAGDFGPPRYAGLQWDGTARFVDTGAHGVNGFFIRQYSNVGGSLYLRLKVNADTLGGAGAFSIGIGGADGRCMCLAFNTDGIRLVNNGGVIAASEAIDMTTWRIVRIQQSKQAMYHGGIDGTSYVRVFVDEVSDLNSEAIGWTAMYDRNACALEHAPLPFNVEGGWLLLGSDAETMQADFTADWVRMTGYRDVYEDPERQKIYIGHPFGLIEPQVVYDDPVCSDDTYSNNVWNTHCDWRVYPHYHASAIVEKDATTAKPSAITYQVVNTSYDNDNTISWTVEEVDSSGTATDYVWLDLDKSGGTLGAAQGAGDTVTAVLNSHVSGLPGGWTVAYLKFTNDTCATEETRRIYVAVRNPADFLVYEYCGDVPPTQSDAAGPGLRFRQWGIQNDGRTYPDDDPEAIEADNTIVEDLVTPDPDAWNGRALRLIEGAKQRSVFLSDDNAGSNDVAGYPEIDRLLGATVVARLKVVSPGLDSYATNRKVGVQISAAGGVAWPTEYAGNMADVWASITYTTSTPVVQDGFRRGQGFIDAEAAVADTTDHYHILRLAVVGGINDNSRDLGLNQDSSMMSNAYGRRIMIWCDEDRGHTQPAVNVLNTTMQQLSSSYQNDTPGYKGFQFGVQERLAGHEVWYDWLTFTNAGAFGPGEENAVIGRGLVPTSARCTTVQPGPCARNFWPDADLDGDVDQDDFARFQTCYGGPGYPYPEEPGQCSCFDRDGNGVVDKTDFAAFTACSTAPGIAGPPVGCAP